MELLREMLNNPNVDEKSRAAAAAHLVQISEALEQEIKTEALIIRGDSRTVWSLFSPVYGGRSIGPDFQLTSGPGRGVEESGVAHGRMSSRECKRHCPSRIMYTCPKKLNLTFPNSII